MRIAFISFDSEEGEVVLEKFLKMYGKKLNSVGIHILRGT